MYNSCYVVVSVENDDEKLTMVFLDEVKGSLIACDEFDVPPLFFSFFGVNVFPF